MSALTACIQHYITGFARVIRQEKETKGYCIGKEECNYHYLQMT